MFNFFLILLIQFFFIENCFSKNIFKYKFKFFISNQNGFVLIDQSVQQIFSGILKFNYNLTPDQSIFIDYKYLRAHKSHIYCNFFQKGMSSHQAALGYSFYIMRDFDSIIDIKLTTNLERAYFNNHKNYKLTGYSGLLGPVIYTKLRDILKYDIRIFNDLKIGTFYGHKSQNNEDNNCTLPRVSLESGFIFPEWGRFSFSLFCQNNLFGQEISENGLNLGIHIKF